MATFTLSIEPISGKSFQHGYHLGTIPSIAKSVAEEVYKRYANSKEGCRTVALMLDGKIQDVFYGDKWDSDLGDDAEAN